MKMICTVKSSRYKLTNESMSEKNCDWAWSPYRFINIEQWIQENNDKKSEMAGQKKCV